MRTKNKIYNFLCDFFDNSFINFVMCISVILIAFASVLFHQERAEKDLTPTKAQIEWEKQRQFVFVIYKEGNNHYDEWELYQINDATGKLAYQRLYINKKKIPKYQKFDIGDTIRLQTNYEWLYKNIYTCDYYKVLQDRRPYYESVLYVHEILLIVFSTSIGFVFFLVSLIAGLSSDSWENKDAAECYLCAMIAFALLSVSIKFLFMFN